MTQEEKDKIVAEAKKLSQGEEATDQNKPAEQVQQVTEEKPTGETIVSKTDNAYEVTAASGDSLTTLARSAVKQFIDTTGETSVSAEQKIYMEDYLARRMGYSHHVGLGEMKKFSENDIRDAMTQAKNLTPSQLEHLKIYSQRVPNL